MEEASICERLVQRMRWLSRVTLWTHRPPTTAKLALICLASKRLSAAAKWRGGLPSLSSFHQVFFGILRRTGTHADLYAY
jgi:hypothetical protein